MVVGSYIDQKYDYTLDEIAESLHTIFVDQNWKWWKEGVPTTQDIKNNILYQIASLDEKTTWSSTGRINVSRDADTDEIVVCVEFTMK